MKKVAIIMAMFAVSASVALADVGEEVYMDKCTKCHGEDGKGNERALQKLLKGLTIDKLTLAPMAEKSDEEMRAIIVEGKEKMPGYADSLTAEEIDAVLAHCRKLVAAMQ